MSQAATQTDYFSQRVTGHIKAAGLYFVFGFAALLASSDPQGFLPCWPPAGVALFYFLAFGYRSVIGLIYGAITLELAKNLIWPETSGISATPAATAWVMALLPIVQGALGSFLVSKFINYPDPLLTLKKIFPFFIVSGPIACLITPAVLFLFNLQADTHQLLGSWFSNTLGVVAFTPILTIIIRHSTPVREATYSTVLLPNILAISLIIASFFYLQSVQKTTSENLLKQDAYTITNNINLQLHNLLESGYLLSSMFERFDQFDREDFAHYTRQVVIRSPDVTTLGWVRHVYASDLATYQQKIKKITGKLIQLSEVTVNATIAPLTDQKEYFFVEYAEPHEPNKGYIGANLSAIPSILRSFQRADEMGSIGVTDAYYQHSNEQSPRVLFSFPVYELASPNTDEIAEVSELSGFIVIEINTTSFLNQLTEQAKSDGINVEVSTLRNNQSVTIYPLSQQQITTLPNTFSTTRVITIADKDWQLRYTPTTAYLANNQHYVPYYTLGWSCLLFLLFEIGLLTLTGQKKLTELVVDQQTKNLVQEIEEHKGTLTSLRISEQRFQLALSCANESVWEWTNKTSSIMAIPPLNQMLGFPTSDSNEEGPLSTIIDMTHPKDQEKLTHHYLTLFNDPETNAHSVQFRLTNADKQWTWIQCSGEVIRRSADGQPERVVGVRIDISDQKAAESEIERLAYYDELTKLPNRRLFLDRLEHELTLATGQQKFGAMLYIDLDHFKTLNDSLGHMYGDLLLEQVAARLKSSLSDEETAARFGGDEFIILLTAKYKDMTIMADEALTVAEKIQEMLTQPYHLMGYKHHVTPSIGISLFPHNMDNTMKLIQHADTAMYKAKSSGRNSICFYEPEMQKAADERLKLENELRVALSHDQLVIYYQPQVNNEGKISGAEALLRWHHPTRGLLTPDAFLPIAEQIGLILPIGDWVLQQACQQINYMESTGEAIDHISVNVSPIQFHQADFVDKIIELLATTEAKPERLTLEITENILLDDLDNTIEKMHWLRKAGVNLSLDDFGTGYSSLLYIKRLPINELKIDREFVNGILEDKSDALIVETIIHMASYLNFTLVAEGVESREQFEFLRSKGCHHYQGYYYYRPMPLSDLLTRLEVAERVHVD